MQITSKVLKRFYFVSEILPAHKNTINHLAKYLKNNKSFKAYGKLNVLFKSAQYLLGAINEHKSIHKKFSYLKKIMRVQAFFFLFWKRDLQPCLAQ